MKTKIFYLVLALSTSALAQDKPNSDAQFREMYPKAIAGDAPAMFGLGKIYLEGTSSAGKDSAKGLNFMHKASAAGNVSAMKYLVDSYERSGSGGALDLCQRLQKMGDKYCAGKMEGIVEKSIPKTANVASCKKMSELYESGNQSHAVKTEVMHCVIQGMSTSIPNDEALNGLRMQAGAEPKIFLRLMPTLLKSGSPQWDPMYVEENLPKTGLTFKDSAVKEILVKNDVTFEGCRKLERLRKETLRQRPSVCRMAAKSGDEDAALYVGESYLNGQDYFPEDPIMASGYIKDVLNSKNQALSSDAFILLLDLYKKQNKFYEHFTLVSKEIKRNSANAKVALTAFAFEANFMQKNHAGMALEDIQEIVDIADTQDVSQSVKSTIGKSIDDVVRDRGRMLRAAEKDSLLYYKKRLLTQKDLEEAESDRQVVLAKSNAVRTNVDSGSPQKADNASEKKELTIIERFIK